MHNEYERDTHKLYPLDANAQPSNAYIASASCAAGAELLLLLLTLQPGGV
jgi:hypothetical protein